MTDVKSLITDNIDLWTSAIKKRNSQGRGSNSKVELVGVKKLRELILELAVRGKLVPQDANDEPASVLLEKIVAEKAQLIADKKIKKQKPLPEIIDEEKPFELPLGWKFVRLGDCSTVFSGSSFKSGVFNSKNGVKVIKITNAGVGKLIETDEFLPEKFLDKYQSFQVFKNDIILALTRPYISDGLKVSLCPKSYHQSLLNQRVAAIRAFQYPEYLFLNLRSPYILNLYKNRFGGNGLQPNLKMSDVTELVIALPPLTEQHRIVAKVDELMTLCDQLEQQTEQSLTAHQTLVEELLSTLTQSVNADDLTAMDGGNEGIAGAFTNTESFQESWQRIADHFDVLFTTEHSIEQLKQTILQLAVMGKLVPQNPSDEPASVLLEKIAKEKAQLIKDKKIKKEKPLADIKDEKGLDLLPNNWQWIRLGEIALFQKGFAFKSKDYLESGLMITKIQNLTDNHTQNSVYINPENPSDFEQYTLIEGDIVMTTVGSWFSAPVSAVGRSFLINKAFDKSLLNQNAVRIRTLNKFNSSYMHLCVNSESFKSYLVQEAQGTANQASITQISIKSFLIGVPPLAEQHRIVAKVDELMALCDQLKTRLADAQVTKLHLADAVVENALN